jgi:hypothetical protein
MPAVYHPELKFKPLAAFPKLLTTHLNTEIVLGACQEQTTTPTEHIHELESYREHYVAPIQKLPEEVLLEIFFHLVNAHDHRGTRRHHVHDKDFPHRWLHFTHVCCAWREIALGCPLLWTRIISGRPERVEAFLTRSGKCSITLEGTNSDPFRQFDPFLHKLMLAERRRLLSVDGLRIGHRRVYQALSNILDPQNLQMPLLESLRLCIGWLPRPPVLWNTDLPRLKRLSSVMEPWSLVRTWIKPTLTHLQIFRRYYSEERTRVDWIAVLEHLPLLEDLHLTNVLFSDPALHGDLFIDRRVAGLPKLRRVRLVQNCHEMRACADLLMRISFPRQTSVIVRGWYLNTEHLLHPYRGYRDLISSLALKEPHLPITRPSLPLSLGCEISLRQPQQDEDSDVLIFTLTLRLGRTIALPDSGPGSDDGRVVLSLCLPTESKRQRERLFAYICETGLLSGVRSLSVDGVGTRVHAWHQLARLDSVPLRHLCVPVGRTLAALMHVLEQYAPRDAAVPSLWGRLDALTVLGHASMPLAGSGRRRPASRLQRLSDALAGLEARDLGPQILDICDTGFKEIFEVIC